MCLFQTSQEDHGVQVDEPEKDTVTEGVQTSARSSRRQSVREDEQKTEEPLHPGYALTPGNKLYSNFMFFIQNIDMSQII